MFLSQTIKNNPALVDYALWAHSRGHLLPDTYVLDLDTVRKNAEVMGEQAKKAAVSLYFMLKQVGRNPAVAKILTDTGYFHGAVAVDFKEALFYKSIGIPLGNVGHLVQTPTAALGPVLDARPEIITVYSLEKARQIDTLARERGFVQDIMLRVVGREDFLYSGQLAGFPLEELEPLAPRLLALKNVRLSGVAAFPCLLYNQQTHTFDPTPNTKTVLKAAEILRGLGFPITQLNMPSASCTASLPIISELGGTHAEPGHGLFGSTPYHVDGGPERQAMVYLSEVSHNFGGKGYCYGGGYYRRGHLKAALVGEAAATGEIMEVIPPNDDSIDYHFGLEHPCPVGAGVVMAFRTQIFVTRSTLALVEGLTKGNPTIAGLYDSFGRDVKV